MCQRQRRRPMNSFYRTSASNRFFPRRARPPPPPPLWEKQTRFAMREPRATAKAPANAHRLQPVREPWPRPRATRGANHAPRSTHRAKFRRDDAPRPGGRFTPGKLTVQKCKIMHDSRMKACIKTHQLSRQQIQCAVFNGCTGAEPCRFEPCIVAAPALMID